MNSEEDTNFNIEDEELDLEIEFGEKTLLEIDEAGRTFRQVLMDENPKSKVINPEDLGCKDK